MSASSPDKVRSRYGASIVGLPQLGDASNHTPSTMQTTTPSPAQSKVAETNAVRDSVNGDLSLMKGLRVMLGGGKTILIDPSARVYYTPPYRNHCISWVNGVRPCPAFVKIKVSPHLCFIDRLPTELLCAIFMMCGDPNKLFSYPRNESSDKMESQNRTHFYSWATVTIGYVCSRWFHTTRSCPQLWTMIDVPRPKLCDIFALRLSLKYSANLPLTLRINDYHVRSQDGSGSVACTVFMRFVSAYASRWEEISIILRSVTPDIVHPLLEISRASYSCLRQAMIHFESDGANRSTTTRLWDLFYASPVLRTCQWFYTRISASESVLHHLTRIGIDDIQPDEIMKLLTACPHLEALQAVVTPEPSVFVGEDDGYLFPIKSPPIILSRLRFLELRGMHDWSRFFESIAIPKIRRLGLSTTGVQAQAISAMLRRSSAHLDALALRRLYSGNDEEVAALLRSHELQLLKVFCYQPYDGPCRRRSPDLFNPSPYLPPAVVLYTKTYEEFEEKYESEEIY